MTPPLLELVSVSKTYPGVKALDRVTLKVERGEVLAAIKLNDDCGFKANEITTVDANRMLPSELEAVQLAAT